MRDGTDARALLADGAAAYGRGEVDEALRLFRAAADTADAEVRVSAMVNAASMCDELGAHADAAALFAEALALPAPGAAKLRAATLINYSQALQHLGDFDGAQSALEQARALLADHPELTELATPCLLSLTAVAIHRQQWVQAAELARSSLDACAHGAEHLAGHALMNLAATHFETGRVTEADDFADQALAAFAAAGDATHVAQTRQNMAIMRVRTARPDEAEPLLHTSQSYFEQAGMAHRAGVGWKVLGLVAEQRGHAVEAYELYARGLAQFEASGAAQDAADIRIRLATMAFAAGRDAEGEHILAAAFAAYAARGLGLHCAQVDFWHAYLLAAAADAGRRPLTGEITNLAVVAALAIDAVRYTLPSGHQRAQWHQHVAEPAMRLAFRCAHGRLDVALLGELIEVRSAGATLHVTPALADHAPPPLPEVLDPGRPAAPPDALSLGIALADVAAGVGIPVAPPPQIALPPDGHYALAGHIAAAERRYGRRLRDEGTVLWA